MPEKPNAGSSNDFCGAQNPTENYRAKDSVPAGTNAAGIAVLVLWDLGDSYRKYVVISG